MSKKMGRPKVENPINISTTLRLDADTNAQLIAYCEKHGISKGEAVRKGVRLLLAQEKE